MLREIRVSGFKRFANASIELRGLTVLAGMNGSGKSTTIQALLLARQAARPLTSVVPLNGPNGLELGTFSDVRNWDAEEDFSISLVDETASHTWRFTGDDQALFAYSEYFGSLEGIVLGAKSRSFQYLSAERYGPRMVLGSAAVPPSELDVGYRGEYAAQVHYSLGDNVVEGARRSPTSTEGDAALVKIETEKWLSYLFSMTIQVSSQSHQGTATSSLQFRTGADWVAATNMGFGVTYCLPIVLAGLTGIAGGVLVVENPEAHLHPAAQSRMGIFLCSMAKAGIQVVIETHSDHIINGIRLAVAREKIIDTTNVVAHYFTDQGTEPQPLSFSSSGSISNWPQGFFDQYQIDIASISRVRAKDK